MGNCFGLGDIPNHEATSPDIPSPKPKKPTSPCDPVPTFVGDTRIDEQLKCIVCFEVPFHPVTHASCGHLLCHVCAGKCQDRCPMCRVTLPTYEDSKLVTRLLVNKMIKCPDCTSVLRFGSWDDHVSKKCPVLCKYASCDAKIFGSVALGKHHEECDLRPTKCTMSRFHCEWVGPERDLKTHLETCPLYAVRTQLELIRTEFKEIARSKVLPLGQRVTSNWNQSGAYPGVIQTQIISVGGVSYGITFDDGDTRTNVLRSEITL